MTRPTLISLIGWIGQVSTMTMYLLTTLNIIEPEGMTYLSVMLANSSVALTVFSYERTWKAVPMNTIIFISSLVLIYNKL